MESNTLLKIIVFATVGVICLSALLIPALDKLDDGAEYDNDLYVFMITGQSNSAYRSADLTVTNNEVDRIPYGSAYYLGTAERPPASNPTGWQSQIDSWNLYSMINEDGTWHIGNYEAQLASSFYHATGKKCLIINAGWDSASIEASQPGEYENTYFKAMFERGMSLIPHKYNVKLGCVFWSQGEADDDMTVNEYKAKFITMWNDYKETMGWGSILIAQTRFDQSPISPTAQAELNGIDDIYLATTVTQTFSASNGLLGGDNQHYSQKGRIVVAKDWMSYYLDNEYRGTSPKNIVEASLPIAYAIPVIFSIAIVLAALKIFVWNRSD